MHLRASTISFEHANSGIRNAIDLNNKSILDFFKLQNGKEASARSRTARSDRGPSPSAKKRGLSEQITPLVVDFGQIVPYLTGGKEAFKFCRPAAGLRIFSFVQFNEFRDRLLNPLDRIADAEPEPPSIKWTLLIRTVH